jgi:hypothetical protein
MKIGDGVTNVNNLPIHAGNWADIKDKPFEYKELAFWDPMTPKAEDADFSYRVSGGRPADIYAIKVGEAPSRDTNVQNLILNGTALWQWDSSDNVIALNREGTYFDNGFEVFICYESGEHILGNEESPSVTFTAEPGIYVCYCDDVYGYEIEKLENGGFIAVDKKIDEIYIPDSIARVD